LAASTPTLASDGGRRPEAPPDGPGGHRPGGPGRAGGRGGFFARAGLAGVTVVALVCFAVYAAFLASKAGEVDQGDAVPITVPGAPVGPFGVGLAAPDFDLQTLDGQRVKLSDYAGRPVWINVWASWCAPCRAEMPDIDQVYRELQGAGTQQGPEAGPALLLISLGEDQATVQRYVQNTKYQLPVLLDPDYSISAQYRVTGLPTHVFIDRTGVIRDIAIGGLKPSAIRARLARITG